MGALPQSMVSTLELTLLVGLLQVLSGLFMAFLCWWVRDLVSQFRVHVKTTDERQHSIEIQISTILSKLAVLENGQQFTREILNDMRKEYAQKHSQQ